MEELKEKVLKEGKIRKGNIVKVDSFLNHQIDVKFLDKIGREFYEYFKNLDITKILTIEASGIPIAMSVARYFGCKVIYGKKNKTLNIADEVYVADVFSYTHNEQYKVLVSKEFLTSEDKVLIIDDFLANGEAINGMINIINEAGATLLGCGIVIEKGFQDGGKLLRGKGINIKSLVIIDSIDFEKQTIEFREEV